MKIRNSNLGKSLNHVDKKLQYSKVKRGSAAWHEYQPEAAEAAADATPPYFVKTQISKNRQKDLQYSEAKRGSAAGLEYQPEAAEAAADDLMSW